MICWICKISEQFLPWMNISIAYFYPFCLPKTQINPTHADKWNAIQGSAVRQARLHRPGYRVHWRLSICAGEVPSERGPFLQSSGRLLDLLRASQLPWPPVLPGEGQLPQTSGVGCGLSHRAVFPSLHWVISLCHNTWAIWLWLTEVPAEIKFCWRSTQQHICCLFVVCTQTNMNCKVLVLDLQLWGGDWGEFQMRNNFHLHQ